MKYNRVLLIKPAYRHSHYEYAGLPAGLGYISEALDKAGIEQEIVDMSVGLGDRHLKGRVRSFEPDLIGITMMSFRYKDHYALLGRLKAEFKGIDIVAGGPHASTFRAKVLEDCAAIDYALTLEGEGAVLELCEGKKELKDIKGLLYRQGDNILYTQDREFQQDLDSVGFPRYRFFQQDKYPKFVSLVTSRGCPHSCIFCPVQLTIGRRLRVRSPESIVDEIEYWYNRGMRIFNIVDDNFTFYKERVLEICDGIKRKGFKGLTLSCRNGVRADTVDREMLEAMKAVGFNYLAFGVESGSEKILKVLKKGETLEDMEAAIKDACDLGFMVTLFFIIGLPGETEDDVYKSFALAKKYPVFDVRFYNLIPFPGTELYSWVQKNGYFNKDNQDYLNSSSHWINKPVFGTPELPITGRKRLYSELNRKIKKHTFKTKLLFSKEIEKLFNNIGLPPLLSKVLARIYYTPFFQAAVVESGLAGWLKR